MSRVITEDKRTGIKYVYEQVSIWSPEHNQARPKKTLIGKIDPVTGEIVPTDGRGRGRRRKTEAVSSSDKAEKDQEIQKEKKRMEQELYLLDALVKQQTQKILKLEEENRKNADKIKQLSEALHRLS